MDYIQEAAPRYDETMPVLIVGGGLVGLASSLFLSWYGVPSLLIERRPGISPHPRAFNFNVRTMELFRMVGVEAAVRCQAPPHFQNSRLLRAESLMGREIGWLSQDTTTCTTSPTDGCIIGQDALEPVLRAQAEALGGRLCFSTELLSFEQDADGVSAVIQDHTTGAKRLVRARYMLAADGNRSAIRQKLGMRTHGPGTFGHRVSMLFSADLQRALRDRRLLVCFVQNSAVPQGTSLVFARNGQGFALTTPYAPDKGESPEDFAGERGVALVRAAVGDPDLPVEILNVSPWEVSAWVAERFQQENIFLVGDAAHVFPPTGSFGASTGIADAYNLSWKLAMVLQGTADAALLETYTEERHPVARATGEQAVYLFRFSFAPDAGKNAALIAPYDSVAFGYRYRSTALPFTPEADGWYEDPQQPSGLPGTHAAHVILEHNGEQLSTYDLFGKGFVLLSGDQGESWNEAGQEVARRLGLPLETYRIGAGGNFSDPENHFLEAYGILSTGSVLVRPDGFIAWRAETTAADLENMLELALTRALRRSAHEMKRVQATSISER